ncbi:response regulator [bacterium]|nr:response regulator [bacterium]
MPNILIIDDYDILLEAMQHALEDEYTVHTARSGEEALGLMELIQPDLVITDMNMPGMSGLELIKRINNVGALLAASVDDVHPKIILYTSMLTPELIAYANGLGVAACLPKPFELEDLKRRIKEILNSDYG